MATWLIPFSDLTPEQQRAVQFSPERHRVIFGGPGSGKTMILLHRAGHLTQTFNIPSERFRIFVFTNVLKNYIQSALGLLNLPQDSVLTYDHWCNLYYTKNIHPRVPWSSANGGPDYEAIRKAVFEHVRRTTQGRPLYDFVLVDEGQDLDPLTFETMKLISGHVTVCLDYKQRIYDNGAGEDEIMRQLGLSKRNMSLLGAYRCCPYVVRLGARFIADSAEREEYLQQSKTDQTERQTPLLYFAGDFEDEKQRLIDVIKTRQAKGERVAILFHLNKHVYGYAKGLREAGLDVEVQKAKEGSSHEPLDFTSDRPKILTYHSAKGLTFDTVIMPQLVERAFYGKRESAVDRLLFVGMTRATRWVYMSAVSGFEVPSLKKLLVLGNEGGLTIQRAGDALRQPEAGIGQQGRPDDFTDLL